MININSYKDIVHNNPEQLEKIFQHGGLTPYSFGRYAIEYANKTYNQHLMNLCVKYGFENKPNSIKEMTGCDSITDINFLDLHFGINTTKDEFDKPMDLDQYALFYNKRGEVINNCFYNNHVAKGFILKGDDIFRENNKMELGFRVDLETFLKEKDVHKVSIWLDSYRSEDFKCIKDIIFQINYSRTDFVYEDIQLFKVESKDILIKNKTSIHLVDIIVDSNDLKIKEIFKTFSKKEFYQLFYSDLDEFLEY